MNLLVFIIKAFQAYHMACFLTGGIYFEDEDEDANDSSLTPEINL